MLLRLSSHLTLLRLSGHVRLLLLESAVREYDWRIWWRWWWWNTVGSKGAVRPQRQVMELWWRKNI
jgi:hypothetical protein